MESLFLFGASGGIKKIQSGLAAKLNPGIVTVNIEKVDLAKSLLFYMGYNTATAGGEYQLEECNLMGELKADKIEFSTYSGGGIYNIPWWVVEFRNIKKVQRGVISLPQNTESVFQLIEPVDLSKTLLFINAKVNSTSTEQIFSGALAYFDSAERIRFVHHKSSAKTAAWQVAEFI